MLGAGSPHHHLQSDPVCRSKWTLPKEDHHRGVQDWCMIVSCLAIGGWSLVISECMVYAYEKNNIINIFNIVFYNTSFHQFRNNRFLLLIRSSVHCIITCSAGLVLWGHGWKYRRACSFGWYWSSTRYLADVAGVAVLFGSISKLVEKSSMNKIQLDKTFNLAEPTKCLVEPWTLFHLIERSSFTIATGLSSHEHNGKRVWFPLYCSL